MIPTPSILQEKKAGPLIRRFGESTAAIIKGIGIGLLAAAIVFSAVLGMLTLLHVQVILGDVQTGLNNHTGTIDSIKKVGNNTNKIAKNLSKGDTTVGKILNEAGVEVGRIEVGQAVNNQNQLIICNALHITGCQPLPASG